MLKRISFKNCPQRKPTTIFHFDNEQITTTVTQLEREIINDRKKTVGSKVMHWFIILELI